MKIWDSVDGVIAVSARSILFTLFGDVFLERRDPVPLASATALLQPLGIGPEAARAALSRTAREGWFTSERRGRQSVYRLTTRGQERLTHASARIYRRQDDPWSGSFSILGLGTPSLPPNTRRKLMRELEFVGWAALGPYQWATPLARHEETMEILDRYELAHSVWILNGALEAPDPRSWVSKLYPIELIDHRYQAFIREWSQSPLNVSEQEAFCNRIYLVHAWRKFLFIDPGLPQELVPPEFSRSEARTLFHRLYDRWKQPSNAFIEHHLTEAVLL